MRRKKRSTKMFLFKSFLVILLILSVFLMLGQKSALTSVQYRINMLEKKKMELIKERKYLIASKARLTSIDNIKKVSSNSDEFRFPDRQRVIYVKTIKEPEARTASLQTAKKANDTEK